MKILHTADWHVGKTLTGRSRADEHEAVLAEICAVARAHEVGLTIVAGDLFDHAAPAPESERIVFEALLALAQAGSVLVLPGNHDNERRLAALAPLFSLAGVTIVPGVRRECLDLEVQGERVRIAVIPWLSQRHIVRADQLMSADAGELQGAYGERMQRIVASLCSGFDEDAVNLVTAHATVAGAQLGGGERTAQTIFDYYVAANVFPASAHYVALGHIHKSQAMPGPCPIHYCGAPLHLDFSDTPDDRSVIVVEAHPGRPATIEHVPLASGRKLRTVRGTLAQLTALAGSTADDYLRVIVEEKQRIGLADEVRALLPHAIKVAVDHDGDEITSESVRERSASPPELFEQYLTGRGIEDAHLLALFKEVHEEVTTGASL